MGSFRPRTIIEYLHMLWRRKLLIILFATAVMVASFNAMAPVRNVFEANALVGILFQSSDEKSAVDVQIAAITQFLSSRAYLEQIASRYKLYGEKNNMDSAIGLLRRDLKVETKLRDYYPQFPVSFTITYKHNDPAMAMQVTNEVVSYFNSANEILEKSNISKIGEIETEITETENRLRQINQQRTANELSTSSRLTIRSQRASLMFSLETLSDKEFSLNQRIIEQKRQIGDQEKLVRSAPLGSNELARSSSAYGVLLTEKARLEAQLKEQKSQYTDKNSKVIQTRTLIAEINSQLVQMEEKEGQLAVGGGAPEMRELRGLQRELATLETDLELTQRDLKRKRQALALLPQIDVSPAEIGSAGSGNNMSPNNVLLNDGSKEGAGADEYSLLFNRYSYLTEKRDSLRRLGGNKGDAGGKLFQILDKAVMPLSPVAPNRLKLMLMACAMAIGIGLMAAVVVEAPRMMMIHDERDVEYLLGAPVIGFIPETLTPSESRRNRKLFLVRTLCIFLLAAVLVPVLAILLKKFEVFQMLAK